MRRYIKLSKGVFHRGVAHLYCFLATIVTLVNLLFLLTTTRGGNQQFLVFAVIFLPIFITTILSGVASVRNNIKMFKLYAAFSMLHIFTAIVLFTGLRSFLQNESVRAFAESYALFVSNRHNYLPVIQMFVTLIIVGLMISFGLIAVSVVLVLKNIQPKTKVTHVDNVEITSNIEQFKEEIESE